ncbi:protein regulator of cytokinesis 1-like isoform X2 [Harmonia axyridis]|uniref:protein regulator of cytokinesis 1-like isoform X2 n=1 Tax=Harmonia axyridis TaxID=115357 RepID=UPI001E2780A5|nr:protein regulator of cytokinesis 1-like isoform X2 [Harmonia axyridis]
MEFEDLDSSIIDHHEWAKDLKSHLTSYTEKYLLQWTKIVIELGVDDIEMEKWVDIFKTQIEERYRDLVTDVVDMKERVLEEITELLAKTQNYANELGLRENLTDINPNERYFRVKKDLMNRSERLAKIMEERQKEVMKLIKKQEDLCNILEKSPYKLSISPIPTTEELEIVQRYVESLEQEKFDREERYLILKEAIGKMAQELNHTPNTDFERDILSETRKDFIITETNMKHLQNCHDDMVRQLANIREEVDCLRNTIDELWNILEESMSTRQLFHEKYNDYTITTLKALKVEVKRCEELKKANIKIFVEKLRVELRELWAKCFHKNEESHANYHWINGDFYTEDVLTYHELEVRKWRNFFSKNEKLIKLLTEHQKQWSHLLDMESKDLEGPNRYKNRGGQLLKEEKERNKLSKKIPLIEEKIKEEALAYLDHTGTPFLVNGTPILEYIESLHSQREEDRKLKLSARKQIREQETLTPARSCLSLYPSSSKVCLTPKPASIKRKLLQADTTGKKPKLGASANSKGKPASSKLNQSRRLSRERSKRLKNCRKILEMKSINNKENLDDTNSTNYNVFEKNISCRDDNCRSTLIPDQILKPIVNIPEVKIIPGTPCRIPSTPTPQKHRTPDGSRLTRTKSNLKLIF